MPDHYLLTATEAKFVTNKPYILIIECGQQRYECMIKISEAKIKRRSNDTQVIESHSLSSDVSINITSTSWMYHVRTKGGKTAGRPPQQYIQMKRMGVYRITSIYDITSVSLRVADIIYDLPHWTPDQHTSRMASLPTSPTSRSRAVMPREQYLHECKETTPIRRVADGELSYQPRNKKMKVEVGVKMEEKVQHVMIPTSSTWISSSEHTSPVSTTYTPSTSELIESAPMSYGLDFQLASVSQAPDQLWYTVPSSHTHGLLSPRYPDRQVPLFSDDVDVDGYGGMLDGWKPSEQVDDFVGSLFAPLSPHEDMGMEVQDMTMHGLQVDISPQSIASPSSSSSPTSPSPGISQPPVTRSFSSLSFSSDSDLSLEEQLDQRLDELVDSVVGTGDMDMNMSLLDQIQVHEMPQQAYVFQAQQPIEYIPPQVQVQAQPQVEQFVFYPPIQPVMQPQFAAVQSYHEQQNQQQTMVQSFSPGPSLIPQQQQQQVQASPLLVPVQESPGTQQQYHIQASPGTGTGTGTGQAQSQQQVQQVQVQISPGTGQISPGTDIQQQVPMQVHVSPGTDIQQQVPMQVHVSPGTGQAQSQQQLQQVQVQGSPGTGQQQQQQQIQAQFSPGTQQEQQQQVQIQISPGVEPISPAIQQQVQVQASPGTGTGQPQQQISPGTQHSSGAQQEQQQQQVQSTGTGMDMVFQQQLAISPTSQTIPSQIISVSSGSGSPLDGLLDGLQIGLGVNTSQHVTMEVGASVPTSDTSRTQQIPRHDTSQSISSQQLSAVIADMDPVTVTQQHQHAGLQSQQQVTVITTPDTSQLQSGNQLVVHVDSSYIVTQQVTTPDSSQLQQVTTPDTSQLPSITQVSTQVTTTDTSQQLSAMSADTGMQRVSFADTSVPSITSSDGSYISRATRAQQFMSTMLALSILPNILHLGTRDDGTDDGNQHSRMVHTSTNDHDQHSRTNVRDTVDVATHLYTSNDGTHVMMETSQHGYQQQQRNQTSSQTGYQQQYNRTDTNVVSSQSQQAQLQTQDQQAQHQIRNGGNYQHVHTMVSPSLEDDVVQTQQSTQQQRSQVQDSMQQSMVSQQSTQSSQVRDIQQSTQATRSSQVQIIQQSTQATRLDISDDSTMASSSLQSSQVQRASMVGIVQDVISIQTIVCMMDVWWMTCVVYIACWITYLHNMLFPHLILQVSSQSSQSIAMLQSQNASPNLAVTALISPFTTVSQVQAQQVQTQVQTQTSISQPIQTQGLLLQESIISDAVPISDAVSSAISETSISMLQDIASVQRQTSSGMIILSPLSLSSPLISQVQAQTGSQVVLSSTPIVDTVLSSVVLASPSSVVLADVSSQDMVLQSSSQVSSSTISSPDQSLTQSSDQLSHVSSHQPSTPQVSTSLLSSSPSLIHPLIHPSSKPNKQLPLQQQIDICKQHIAEFQQQIELYESMLMMKSTSMKQDEMIYDEDEFIDEIITINIQQHASKNIQKHASTTTQFATHDGEDPNLHVSKPIQIQTQEQSIISQDIQPTSTSVDTQQPSTHDNDGSDSHISCTTSTSVPTPVFNMEQIVSHHLSVIFISHVISSIMMMITYVTWQQSLQQLSVHEIHDLYPSCPTVGISTSSHSPSMSSHMTSSSSSSSQMPSASLTTSIDAICMLMLMLMSRCVNLDTSLPLPSKSKSLNSSHQPFLPSHPYDNVIVSHPVVVAA